MRAGLLTVRPDAIGTRSQRRAHDDASKGFIYIVPATIEVRVADYLLQALREERPLVRRPEFAGLEGPERAELGLIRPGAMVGSN